jgi:hypothetical protein
MKFEVIGIEVCFKGNWLKKGETFDADLKDFDFVNEKVAVKEIQPDMTETIEKPVKAKKTTKKVK